MAQLLSNEIFTGFEVTEMKKQVSQGSEASTCFEDTEMKKQVSQGSEASTCDLNLDTFDFKKQESNRSYATTSYSEEAEESPEWTVGLSKEQILAMGAELLQGFSAQAFQADLQKLLRNSKTSGDVPGRMELALTVQSKVLPKYGLPGTFEGVAMMLDAVSPFGDDYMVQQMVWAIDEKLGMKAKGPGPVSDGEMGKVHYLSMAEELLDGFSTADFQRKLQTLLRNRKSTTDVPGRMELALTVQSKVLPKYGFPGTPEGIVEMLDAISPFTDDDKMQDLLWAIDEKLGIHPTCILGWQALLTSK
mmetsp:Transcript_144568/g.252022  ORF Transcript_144568/g.252022 Transcript_144568/m.252022 type:complete len:304 (+) Transcript_144568:80-991(+)